jgi:hypothetical protein
MMWQFAHAAGSFVSYDAPRAYTNVKPPRPRATPPIRLAAMASGYGFMAVAARGGARGAAAAMDQRIGALLPPNAKLAWM